MTRLLVTGPVRSGKSRHAEGLLTDEATVDYVAPGALSDPERDPEWAERVAEHRRRRPSHWHTRETADLAAAIEASQGVVLIDCLGTWLTAQIDRREGWQRPVAEWREEVFADLDAAIAAMIRHDGRVIAVTNEVGWGVVPEYSSGRIFRDLLGSVNQRWAAACDEVHLVVAGRVLVL